MPDITISDDAIEPKWLHDRLCIAAKAFEWFGEIAWETVLHHEPETPSLGWRQINMYCAPVLSQEGERLVDVPKVDVLALQELLDTVHDCIFENGEVDVSGCVIHEDIAYEVSIRVCVAPDHVQATHQLTATGGLDPL